MIESPLDMILHEAGNAGQALKSVLVFDVAVFPPAEVAPRPPTLDATVPPAMATDVASLPPDALELTLVLPAPAWLDASESASVPPRGPP